jgi:uncharacterized cupin superfamily protein
MPNIKDPYFDEPRESDGFHALRARISRQAGSERLGLSLWQVEAGQAAYPYHYHHTEEELVIVLEGTASLRTPEGWRELEEGEVVALLRGGSGAHQLVNRGPGVLRFLAFSNHGEPDIVIYPDSQKIGAFERRPDGSGLWTMFRASDSVSYWDGESPPEMP